MGIEYLSAVKNCQDTYCVDLQMFDIPKFGCAYIIDAERPAIIETGMGTRYERILNALDALDVSRDEVEAIVPTHVHLDHAGGAGYLAEALPNATVLVHERGVRHLVDPSRLVAGTKQAVGEQWKFYEEPIPVPEARIEGLSDGDEIALGDQTLEAHHAPGHASHQHIFYNHTTDWVFSADAVGIYAPQRDKLYPTTPPVDFDLEQSLRDLDRIESLSPRGLLYTHFGPREGAQSAIDEYRECLTEWVNAVEQKWEEFDDEERIEEYFVERTETTEVWGEEKAVPETRMNVRGVLKYLKEREL